MHTLWLVLVTSLSTATQKTPVDWPALPSDCFVSGRAAGEADANRGCAAFVIKGTRTGGKPLEITIPQYALHIDEATGKATPVILIQAEENSGVQVVGYKTIDTGAIGATLLSEMRLLGIYKPSEPGT